MKIPSSFVPALIPAILIVAHPLPSASALSSREVGMIAEAVTVRINGQNPGSGVLIRQQGNRYTVLTAAHVVATQDEYEVITPDQESYLLDYATVKPFPGVDLALVEFTSSNAYSVVKVGNSQEIRSGDAVYVSGFPMPTAAITAPIWTFSPGSVTANAKRALADGYALVYTNNTLPGMSGGAVLDETGKLVGIHGRADTDQQTQLTDGVRIKTGFNLAIPSNTFMTLVTQVNPNLGFAGQVSVSGSNELTADDWFLSGGEKQRNRNFRGAIADYNKAIAIRPNYASAYLDRGNARSSLGDLHGAIADFDQAIAIQPDDPLAYNNRGTGRGKLGDLKGAIADINKAIAIRSSYAEAYYNRGFFRHALGDLRGAIIDFDQAIAIRPDFVEAYYNRGSTRYQLGSSEEALTDFDQAIAIRPDFAEVHNNRGFARAALGDPQGAIEDYGKAIALQPNVAEYYNNRGTARFRFGDPQGGMADLDQAITLQPDYAKAYHNRGFARQALGNQPGAIADFRSAARLFKAQGNLALYEKMLEQIKGLSQ